MKIKYKLTSLIAVILLFTVNSCTSSGFSNVSGTTVSDSVNFDEQASVGLLKEGPDSTGVLKEGPDSTGPLKEGPDSTGALKEGPDSTGSRPFISNRSVILSMLDNKGDESVIAREQLTSVELISEGNSFTVTPDDIANSFSTMSYSSNFKCYLDEEGRFGVSSSKQSDNLIIKFYFKGDRNPVVIPFINIFTHDNLKAVIYPTGNDGWYVSGWGVNSSGKVEKDKPIFEVFNSSSGQTIIKLIGSEGKKISYFLEKLEKSIKEGLSPTSDEIEGISQETYFYSGDNTEHSGTITGIWFIKFFENEIILKINKVIPEKYLASVMINGITYYGTGKPAESGKTEFKGLYKDTEILMDVRLAEDGSLRVLVRDTGGLPEIEPYKGLEIELSRK